MATNRNSRGQSKKQLQPAIGHWKIPTAKTFLRNSHTLNALQISMHIPNDQHAMKNKPDSKKNKNN